jgi:hypothetical protein
MILACEKERLLRQRPYVLAVNLPQKSTYL